MMRRSGYSLVEAVGVIGAIGMLLTLSALLLNKTFDAHRGSLLHLQRMRSIELFADRWREDVQSSTGVTPGAELRIAKADNTEIVYSIIKQSVVRTRRQDGQDVGHDHWQLPSKFTVDWQIEDQGQIPLLVGKLEFSGDPVAFDPITLVSRIGSGGGK
jgi:hypothetical protein